MLSRSELGSFTYAGQTIRVIDSQGGIWNPGASWTLGEELRATLSINTTKSGKYEDQEVSGGLWRYDYQSGGTAGKNTKMRKAMELQLPSSGLFNKIQVDTFPTEFSLSTIILIRDIALSPLTFR